MNTALAPHLDFAGKDFRGGGAIRIPTAARQVSLEFSRPAESTFSAEHLTPTGIADSLCRIVVGRSADLSRSLHQRISELSTLKPNWNQEGAKAIKSYVLGDVVEALKRFAQRIDGFREPFLAPTFDGFVQMEWHDDRRSLEIEAVNQGWSLVGTRISTNGKHQYFTAESGRSDFERMEHFYNWWAGAELLWPSL